MPTDRISSSSSIIETMRAIAKERASGTQRGRKASAPGSVAEETATTGARQIAVLRERLYELAKSIDLDNMQSVVDARAPVVREILLWEFGSDFRQDPQFLPTVDAISATMDLDPRFQQRFLELISGLQKGATGTGNS